MAEEVIHAFAEESGPRQRIDPARRLLDVLRVKNLPLDVAERLVLLARTHVDFRFLMNHVPSRELAQALLYVLRGSKISSNKPVQPGGRSA